MKNLFNSKNAFLSIVILQELIFALILFTDDVGTLAIRLLLFCSMSSVISIVAAFAIKMLVEEVEYQKNKKL